VAIGSGDGYMRCLSTLASASIRDIDAPGCGRVSMDQLILDVTDVPVASLEELGRNSSEHNRVVEPARYHDFAARRRR
jgi:alanine racemase